MVEEDIDCCLAIRQVPSPSIFLYPSWSYVNILLIPGDSEGI